MALLAGRGGRTQEIIYFDSDGNLNALARRLKITLPKCRATPHGLAKTQLAVDRNLRHDDT
jgi:hypothetical protein